jgi:tRNA A37 methylthiotransferase MiaB
VGKTLQVLLEENYEGFARGYTENYIPIRVDGKKGIGEIVNVKITGTDSLGCVGEVVE